MQEKQHSWTLLGWENGSWYELGSDFNEEDDAIRALAKARDQADLDDDPAFEYFALMRDDEEAYPPDPTL